ncbi:LPXTG cell wall anchor domain-containing protein, partial [Nocardioides marmoribigeumensis]
VYGTLDGDDDCQVGTLLAAGAECSFSITRTVSGDFSGPDHVNVFTAQAVDNDGTEATDDDDATVDFTDVAPAIEVTKTPSRDAVPETGAAVVFTFTVTNTSAEEPVTVTSLSDSVYGTLDGDDDCQVGTLLAAGAECTFSITRKVAGSVDGPDHVNVFTAVVADNDGTTAEDTDDAVVRFAEVLPEQETRDPHHPQKKPVAEVRPAPRAPAAVLPATGGPQRSLLWAGASALLAGFVLVVAGRRRGGARR